MGHFCPKISLSKRYLVSAKTLYTEYLTFNYLCGNSQSYLSIYHFLQHSSSVLLQLKKYMISRKVAHQVQIFRLSAARVKVQQISDVIFHTKNQLFFNVWISFQCHERSFCTFSAETLYAIDKSSTSKCKFSDLPLLRLKFTKFLMSFLESRVSFFFKILITLQCYET